MVKLTMLVFFKRRVIKGANNIPSEGPLLLVANHPVTFLDPLLVAVSTKRTVYFLAKGAMFKNGLIRFVFKRFKMIPIYRAQDDPSKLSQNSDTFEYCYKHLEKNGVLLIFPEGISVTDRTIKKIKTGAARIALGAEMKNNFSLGLKIIPFGLNYESPHVFRKDVLVNIGAPISVKEYKTLCLSSEMDSARKLTQDIEMSMKDLVVNLENEELSNVLEFVLHENALSEMPIEKNLDSLQKIFGQNRNLKDMEILTDISRNLDLYIAKQNELGLEVNLLQKGLSIGKETILTMVTFVIGMPIFIFGFIHNLLPYYLSPRLAKLISKEYEYQGPLTMTAGMVICLITYPIYGYIAFLLFGNWIVTLLYIISLPMIGLMTYGFYLQIHSMFAQWKLLTKFNKEKELIAELILQKKEIKNQLDELLNQITRENL